MWLGHSRFRIALHAAGGVLEILAVWLILASGPLWGAWLTAAATSKLTGVLSRRIRTGVCHRADMQAPWRRKSLWFCLGTSIVLTTTFALIAVGPTRQVVPPLILAVAIVLTCRGVVASFGHTVDLRRLPPAPRPGGA
ncbi:MAG: hypothetical protein SNJ82_11865 [Gemmataceae bacterium]